MFDHVVQRDYIVLDGSNVDIENVVLLKDCYDNGNVIGTATAAQLSFSVALTNLENKEFVYHAVTIDGSGVETDITVGTFITVEATDGDTEDTTNVTAMDVMLRFNVPYVSDLDYSTNPTLTNVLNECCTKCGVALKSGQTLANASFVVDSNQFTDGQLSRDVIAAIAGITGSFAHIVNDELVFTTPSMTATPTINVLPTQYATLNLKRQTRPINTVILSNSQVEGENVTMTDGSTQQYILNIADNPFAYSQDKRTALIQGIYDAVHGFGYYAFEAEGLGNATINCGDPVLVTDLSGGTYRSFVFRMEYRSPDGVQSTLSAPSETVATVNYQYTPTTADKLKRTEILVDKANGQITSVAEYQQVLTGQIETNYADLKAYVEANYIPTDPSMTLDEKISSMIAQTAEQIRIEFNQLATINADNIDALSAKFGTYFNFSDTGFEIGKIGDSASKIVARFTNERMEFVVSGTDTVLAYVDGASNKLKINLSEIGALSIGDDTNGYLDFDMQSTGLFIKWR